MKICRLILLLVLLVAAILATAQQEVPLQVQEAIYSGGSPRRWIPLLESALAEARESQDGRLEAYALYWLGASYQSIQAQKSAADFYHLASEAFHRVADEPNEVKSLNRLSVVLVIQGLHDKAVETHLRARDISRSAGDKAGEATSLNNLGTVYQVRSDWTKALGYYGEALLKASGNAVAEATVLNNIGTVYINLGRPDKAQDALERANHFWELAGGSCSRDNTGLIAMGANYLPVAGPNVFSPVIVGATFLGVPEKIDSPAGLGYAKTIENLGGLCAQRGNLKAALRLFYQGLDLLKKENFLPGMALAYSNIAAIEAKEGDVGSAIKSESNAIDFWQQSGCKPGEAASLIGLASFQNQLGQRNEAAESLRGSLLLWQSAGDRSGEAIALAQFRSFYAKEAPDLAIHFGKEAVNLYQSLRGQISALPQDIREAYRESVSSQYRNLADLLIQLGRIPEAELVLRLLKDEEVSKFLRQAAGPLAGTIEYTQTEAAWDKEYEEKTKGLAELGAKESALLEVSQRTEEQEAELQAIRKQIVETRRAFQEFLSRLESKAKKMALEGRRMDPIKASKGIQGTLFYLPAGTVAVYTLAAPDALRLIFISPSVERAHTIPISAAELSKKVESFRDALQHRGADVQARGKELYDLLVGPLEEDLKGSGATRIMWSLDEWLRYIPVAALFDGKQYLVERFGLSVFNPSATGGLERDVPLPKRLLAAGVSQARTIKDDGGREHAFSALDGVPSELKAIKDAFPATKLLPDGAFTLESLRNGLEDRPAVLHLATHFEFSAVDPRRSFLLTGAGPVLGLKEADTLSGLSLAGLHLLTLSACETGLAASLNNEDGSEVEGLAVVFLVNGAEAVVSTLWPVADDSTPVLMGRLYKEWATHPELGKAEALRRAQLAMLSGEIKEPSANTEHRGIEQVSRGTSFRPDPKRPFAHPYYWAPFVLSGNWK